MRLNKQFKVIVILIIFSILIVSSTGSIGMAEIDPAPGQQYLLDSCYEKFPGDKIQLNEKESYLYGEWGNLELTPFIIQPSTDFIKNQVKPDELINMFKSSRQWIFRNATLNDIHSIFSQAGLDENVCNELLRNTSPMHKGNGFVTTPSDSIVMDFTAEIKAKLYPIIGKYEENIMYSQPAYFYSDDAAEWFYRSNITDKLVEKVLSLTYVITGICYLSDTHLILPLLKSEDDRINFIKAVYRTKTLDVKLVVSQDEDISNIADYWGNLGRTSDVKPKLESLSNQPGGGKIEITDLLPEIPQDRLNTYSGIYEYDTDWKHCHWTTINFFNSIIDERYYNSPNMFSVIGKISKPTDNSQLKFGDIISIFNNNNELVHSCIYIADNLTLTKNGMGNLMPFVISNIDKTISLYGEKAVYLSRTVSNTFKVKL